MLAWRGLAHVVLHSHTHIPHNTHLALDSCRLQLGKLSPSAPRGVPPNLIVTFPYRTRWHLVDFFCPIILAGKWLFLISHVMVYGNSEGPGEGNVWGEPYETSVVHRSYLHRYLPPRVCFPGLWFGCFTSLCLILFQMVCGWRATMFPVLYSRMGQCEVVIKTFVFDLSKMNWVQNGCIYRFSRLQSL